MSNVQVYSTSSSTFLVNKLSKPIINYLIKAKILSKVQFKRVETAFN